MDLLNLILGFIPYGKEIMIVLGTMTTVLTVVSPFVCSVAKWTEWKWDDGAIRKLKANPIAKKIYQVGKQFKRFSLV